MISIGLDVGKEKDPAALAVLHSQGPRPESHRPLWKALSIGNIELGTSYQQLASLAVGIGRDFVAAGFPTVLTIDATGIGAAVTELARTEAPELHIIGVTISGGRVLSHHSADTYVVGKHRLTEVVQVALQQQGLEVPASAGARELSEQMRHFTSKKTASGGERHEASSGHDDLVLCLELAMWTGDTLYDQHAGVAP